MRRNTLFECTDVLKINSKKKIKKILKNPLTKTRKCGILIFVSFDAGYAGIAQLAEQLICNQQVVGSSPITSSKNGKVLHLAVFICMIVCYEMSSNVTFGVSLCTSSKISSIDTQYSLKSSGSVRKPYIFTLKLPLL